MSKYIIEKSTSLHGTIKIGGAKNAVLPIMAAALLTGEKCILLDVPALKDVFDMQRLIEDLGVATSWNAKHEKMEISADSVTKFESNYETARLIRASFLLMGPLLARFGQAKIPLPGGCAIGSRPIDLHLKGFAAMGAQIVQEHGFVEVTANDNLHGAKIYLDFPSVGATENIIMCACLARDQTIIENAAVEPEIVDLSNFLNACGADIRGAGTDTIKITGVRNLHGTTHTVIPDRIEAGTFMAVAAATHGDVYLENTVYDHLKPMIAKLNEVNVITEETERGIHIYMPNKARATDLKTLPYPGFPTDMQAQFMSVLATAEGTSIITETVFDNRFMHVDELKRMGADIKIESRSAIIEGVDQLTGTKVKATDLRAGAALLISALSAEGMTEISDIHHIERGYNKIDKKLRQLGARIERIED